MRRAMLIILCLGACGLGIAACGGSSTTSTTPQAVTTTPEDTGGEAAAAGFRRAGRRDTVSGGGRKTVKLGQTVTIQVVADTTDEVHLHGYDKKVDVAKGRPATLTFTADVPGIFEVELESAGLKLLDLVVK